jgi:hypothetical protein
MRLVAPLVATGLIAVGLSMDDGSRMSGFPTLLWAAPTVMLVLAFVGATVSFAFGLVLGSLVGWVWSGADFGFEGGEIAGAGGAVGGLIAGLALALY